MKNIIIILALLIGLAGVNKCIAYDRINKNLNLVKGYSYLLDFNDKIIRYSLGNTEAAKIELMSSIYSTNQEMILKTLKETDTNLLIWTKDEIYNFNINIIKNKPVQNVPVISEVKNSNPEISPIIQDFSKDDKDSTEDLSLDKPPHIPENIFGFEIDRPPGR